MPEDLIDETDVKKLKAMLAQQRTMTEYWQVRALKAEVNLRDALND